MGLFKRVFHKHLTIKCLGCGTIIDCNYKRPVGEPEFRFIRCASCTLINVTQHDMLTAVDKMELSMIGSEVMTLQEKEAHIRHRLLTEDECTQIVTKVLKKKGGVWWKYYEESANSKVQDSELIQVNWLAYESVPFEEVIKMIDSVISINSNRIVEELSPQSTMRLKKVAAFARQNPYSPAGDSVILECMVFWHVVINRSLRSGFESFQKIVMHRLRQSITQYAGSTVSSGGLYVVADYDKIMLEYDKYPQIVSETEQLDKSAAWKLGLRLEAILGGHADIALMTYICAAGWVAYLNLQDFCTLVRIVCQREGISSG